MLNDNKKKTNKQTSYKYKRKFKKFERQFDGVGNFILYM